MSVQESRDRFLGRAPRTRALRRAGGHLSVFCIGAAVAVIAAFFPGPADHVRVLLIAGLTGALAIFAQDLFLSRREHEEESRSILELAHESFVSVDAAGLIRQWNRQAEIDFGWSREEALGRSIVDLIVPRHLRDEGLDRIHGLGEHAPEPGKPRRREEMVIRRDGSEFPVEISTFRAETTAGTRFNSFVHDISDRRARDARLREAEERFRRAFEDAAIGMALATPEGRWLRVNRALCEITGYSEEKLTGLAFREITHPEDRDRDREALGGLVSGALDRFQTEKRYFHADGHLIWISLNVSVVRDEDGRLLYLISQMQDVTERKQAEGRLAYQASHDALTGLPNRVLLDDRLTMALARLRRGKMPLALLYCDLDRFKLVNDSFGHDAGDRLLLEAAQRLRGALRPSDTVARLGGDEFAILCEELSPDAAATLARRLGDELAKPFEITQGHQVVVTSSIGIAVNSDARLDPGTLLANADAAMYEAKTRGRSRYAFFAAEMRTRASEKLELEADLRNALHDGSLDVHFQPQVELATGRIRGLEALARWHHRRRGVLPAAEFVPTAEESDLIVSIGGFVLEKAMAEAVSWRESGAGDLTLTVNISPRQLTGPELPSLVAGALARHPLPPEALHLEVSEWAIAEDPEAAFETLRDLKDLGVCLDVGEFGVGASSLGLMRRLPGLDVLKVDRSFVAGLGKGGGGGLVEVILGMAEALGMHAIAEGVETEEQASALRDLGCYGAQGYHFSRPLPAEEVGALLARAVERPLGASS